VLKKYKKMATIAIAATKFSLNFGDLDTRHLAASLILAIGRAGAMVVCGHVMQ
jgi:hypothetical protein